MANKLLVLLCDGFRWDYLDSNGKDLKGFKRLLNEGVKADYLEPVFPSLSYPNYYSLMTGLYCEDHGMVGNYMYSEERGERFDMMANPECRNSHWWEDAEPFWITAVKQGKKTYMFEWSGGEFPHKGFSSTYSIPVDGENWPMFPEMKRNIQKSLDMFKSDEIDMAGVFVWEIDKWGHDIDTKSDEFNQKLVEFDTAIYSLLDQLEQQSLRDKVNIVIFSDHGMKDISPERTVDISHILNTTDVKIFTDRGHMCNIWPHDHKLEKVYSDLKKLNNDHITIYRKDELPERWCYKHHKLVPPITVVAESGWFILTPEYPSVTSRGWHGFDNVEKDMRGIFLATGPDIKKNEKVGPMKAVDVYQVLCKLLHVKPLPHKGEWNRVQDIFL